MATKQDPTHCHHCGRRLGFERLTLPRARTGDLAFCNVACAEAWRHAARATGKAPTG